LENSYPNTPDGRYFVVRGRLWRRSNPNLDDELRESLVKELMAARRAVRDAKGHREAMAAARKWVNKAKIALGERGDVWWKDGAPDFNRHLIKNTSYADWFMGESRTDPDANRDAADTRSQL
jgi:hypothetical protein